MQNPLKIERSFIVRHKILEVLYKDWEEKKEENKIIGSIKISNKTKIPIVDIDRWHQLLIDPGEITASENDGQYMMSIQPHGRNAYVTKKYLKEGKKEKWDGIFAWGRIVIPLAAVILALITFFANSDLKRKTKHLEERIQQLENKIQPKK